MNLDDTIARAITDHIEHRDVELDRYEVEDLAEAIARRLQTARDLLVLEDLPEDEDEAVIIHPGPIALDGYPVGDLAASGIPVLPVWTTLEGEAAAGLVVVDCLPLARAQRRWWRIRIRARVSRPGRRLEATWWKALRRIRTARANARRLVRELGAW